MTGALVALCVAAVLPWALPGRLPGRAPGAARGQVRRADLDVAVLLDLADAALDAGCSVPGTLQALGRCLGAGHAQGAALEAVGGALLLGAGWEEAWRGAPVGLVPLADALEPAWLHGAAPGPVLRGAAAAVRAGRQRRAQEAAARLGVRLVLPLGLCFLPAFVLLGVVPVVLAAGGGVLGG